MKKSVWLCVTLLLLKNPFSYGETTPSASAVKLSPTEANLLQTTLRVSQSENNSETELSAAQNEFVEKLILAINHQSYSEMKALLHPRCLEKINAQNAAYYEAILTHSFTDKIPADRKISIKPIEEKDNILSGPFFSYPVKASHWLQVDYHSSTPQKIKINSSIFQIAESDGHWFVVIADPTAQGLEKFQEKQEKEKLETEQAKEIAKDLDPPFIAELKSLSTLEASRKLTEVKHVSTPLAWKILKFLNLD